jgi:hypothetical protein
MAISPKNPRISPTRVSPPSLETRNLSPPLASFSALRGKAEQAKFLGDFVKVAHEKLTEAARLFDLPEHRIGQIACALGTDSSVRRL